MQQNASEPRGSEVTFERELSDHKNRFMFISTQDYII